MRELGPMPTTPKGMRHFGQAGKKTDWQASQSVSFSQIVSRPPKKQSGHPTLATPTETLALPPLPFAGEGWGEGDTPE